MQTTYTIEQAAELTGVTRHTLRYYERIGLLDPVGRAPSGHRRFGEEDLYRVRFLQLLRGTGMPIADMVRFVELTRGGDATMRDRVELLERHRISLRSHIAQLQEHLRAIDAKVGWYRSELDRLEAEPAVAAR